MQTGKQISIGFSSYGKALDLVFSNGLWVYLIYPIIISCLIFAGIFAFTSAATEWIKTTLFGWTGLDEGGFLGGALSWLISGLVVVVFFFINSTFNKYVMLIVMSPVMAILSEKTEQLLTGKTYPFKVDEFVRDIFRGILIATRNMLIEYGIILLCFFLLFIPIIGFLLSVVFLSLVSYYFYGYSMIDYCCERKRMNISTSNSFIWKHKWLAITNGFVFWIIFNLPLIGGIFAPVLAPIAAAISVNELDKTLIANNATKN